MNTARRILSSLAVLAMIGTSCGGPDAATAADAPAKTTAPDTSIALKITAVTTTLPPSAEAPDGFEYHDVSSAGFGLAVPTRWVAVNLTTDDLTALLTDLDLDPDTETLVLQGMAGGVALMAIDIAENTNVNVISVPRQAGESLDNIESLAAAQIEQAFGGTIVSTDRVEVDGREAVKIVYEADFGTGPAEGHQYYIVADSAIFIATFTTFSEAADRDVFAQVMGTFELIS